MRASRWLLFLAAVAAASGGCDAMSPDDPGNLVPPTVTEDATLPAITMNGIRFHVETLGDPANPVIVFLHGGPGGDYRSLLALTQRYGGRSLADDYFLVFWDQRGCGLSERVDKEFLTQRAYLDDLAMLVDRYSPGRPVYLVGESWGGMFAVMYIDEYPERVAGAVLVEPGPLTGATMERLKGDIDGVELGSEWLNDIAWSSQFLSPDDHVRMDYSRMLGMRDGQPRFHQSKTNPSPFWRLGAAANRYIMEDGQDGKGRFVYDFTRNLSAYTTPVLFVAGSWSEILGESLQREQVQLFPSASLEVVDGAGHDVAWVKTAQVLSHIWAYLEARQGGIS